MSRFLSALAAAVCGLVMSATVSADIIAIQSDNANSENNLGSFTGLLDYQFIGGNTGVLNVSLTNTSDLANGGFITAFAFNVGSSDALAAISLTAADYPFLDTAGGSANPFGGSFVGGAALGGNFEGGGNPNNGIAIGATGNFTFSVTASDASLLTASSFLEGPYAFNFIVRFRGFEDGGSDKVPGTLVPAPGAIALLGLAGLTSRRRRRG